MLCLAVTSELLQITLVSGALAACPQCAPPSPRIAPQMAVGCTLHVHSTHSHQTSCTPTTCSPGTHGIVAHTPRTHCTQFHAHCKLVEITCWVAVLEVMRTHIFAFSSQKESAVGIKKQNLSFYLSAKVIFFPESTKAELTWNLQHSC